jgi:Fe-S-cluster containining protein
MARIKQFVESTGVVPKEQGLICPFYQGGHCKIYTVRPLLCRIFGHTEKLKCERGYNVNLPNKKIRKLLLKNGIGVGMLHSFIEGGVDDVIRRKY